MFSSREWIEARTGESVNFENIYAMELPWANASRILDNSGTRSEIKLPSRSIVEGYARLWCTSFEGLVFPIISKWLFTETLDLAYGLGHVFGSGSARACVYSFLALVTLFEFGDNLHGAMDCGSYASAAQNLMPQIMQEMTPTGLEALVMLVRVPPLYGSLSDVNMPSDSIPVLPRRLPGGSHLCLHRNTSAVQVRGSHITQRELSRPSTSLRQKYPRMPPPRPLLALLLLGQRPLSQNRTTALHT
jgi:hypothetical protein